MLKKTIKKKNKLKSPSLFGHEHVLIPTSTSSLIRLDKTFCCQTDQMPKLFPSRKFPRMLSHVELQASDAEATPMSLQSTEKEEEIQQRTGDSEWEREGWNDKHFMRGWWKMGGGGIGLQSHPIRELWIIKLISLISSIKLIWPRNMAIWREETKEGGTN